MIHILYHKSDIDGHASGAITRYYYEIKQNETVNMIPISYDEEIPWQLFKNEDKVILVDFHLHKKDFDKLDKVFIIDHHESFLRELGVKKALGYIRIDKAACELCWEYFFPEEQMPYWLWLIGRYDIWDKNEKWESEILPFQYRLKSTNTEPSTEFGFTFWKHLIEQWRKLSDIEDLIEEGHLIMKAMRVKNKRDLELYGFEAEFEGYKALCLNTPEKNSQIFDGKWDPAKYDIMLRFVFKGEKYEVSLYTTKDIDVSKIAGKYGGGGHKQAAGFHCKDLSFLHKCQKLL